jgi:hypothetical protein
MRKLRNPAGIDDQSWPQAMQQQGRTLRNKQFDVSHKAVREGAYAKARAAEVCVVCARDEHAKRPRRLGHDRRRPEERRDLVRHRG